MVAGALTAIPLTLPIGIRPAFSKEKIPCSTVPRNLSGDMLAVTGTRRLSCMFIVSSAARIFTYFSPSLMPIK